MKIWQRKKPECEETRIGRKTKRMERNEETAEKETTIGRKTKQRDSPSVSSFFLYKEAAEKETGIERNRYRKKNETEGLSHSFVFLPI